jgi:hypothetical protein
MARPSIEKQHLTACHNPILRYIFIREIKMQTKICSKCKIEKNTTAFSKRNDTKNGFRSECRLCCAKKKKQYYIDNKEHLAELNKQYRQNNKEPIAEQRKQYRHENKQAIAKRMKQYHQDNKEAVAAKKKQWYQDNKEHIAEYQQSNAVQISEQRKKYQQANAEHIAARVKLYNQTPQGKAVAKASKHNRRARKLQNGGTHTGKQILALFNQQSGVCPYCKAKLHKSGKNKYHSDHVMPLSKGGTNDISNIQLLCPTCNLTKNNKLPEEFAANFNKLF